jgi:long-chain acyl-CoA synthetase
VDAEKDVAVLQSTGGTTGVPKGAMLTHLNLVANVYQAAAWIPEIEEMRMLAAIPMFHVFGLTVALLFSIRVGATIILYPNPREIGPILKLITKTRPTFFPGVPTMYVAMLNHPKLARANLRGIRACLSGAAPLPLEVSRRFGELTGGKLVEGYGLTEASPIVIANPLTPDGLVKECIGIPFPDTDIRIVDVETGTKDVPAGERGELIVRGPQVMKGYWGKAEDTKEVLRDGWLYTGDVATMDEDGYFHIVERKKDLIIASGYNVYPREVEEVLFEHPAVQEAAVLGVPDPYRGETVKAYVVLKAGATATEAELLAFCKERLAVYKVPKLLEFREELPKTIVGKVLRRALREEEVRKGAK